MIGRTLALAALLAVVQSNFVSAQEADVRTTMDGVYSAEQAAQGKEIYQRVCSACHVLDYYAGDVLRVWEGTPVFGLYDLIRTKMPENNPGSLRSREYVAMIAYILELNGMPPGEEALSARSSALQNIIFQWRDES